MHVKEINVTYPFIGLTVYRGPDWQYDDQDGNGLSGVIYKIDPNTTPSYNWVRVQWYNGHENTYRYWNNESNKPVSELSCTSEDLLNWFKANYPPGTTYKTLDASDISHEALIEDLDAIKIYEENPLRVACYLHPGYLFLNNQLAEIIPTEKVDLNLLNIYLNS